MSKAASKSEGLGTNAPDPAARPALLREIQDEARRARITRGTPHSPSPVFIATGPHEG